MCVYVCVCECVYVCVSVSVCKYVCMCVCEFVCMCVYVCASVCIVSTAILTRYWRIPNEIHYSTFSQILVLYPRIS